MRRLECRCRDLRSCSFALFFVLLTTSAVVVFVEVDALVTLKSTVTLPATTLPNVDPSQTKRDAVYQFLATPSNWPKIVLSSVAVQPVGSSVQLLDNPLKRGDRVEEIFGLPVILPLTVAWTCIRSDVRNFVLDLRSETGVAGLARDCRMLFELSSSSSSDDDNAPSSSVTVDLTMEYEPVNALLGQLAIPVLTMDNAIALRVLLPMALQQQQQQQRWTPLDEFRSIMGSLYGVAGVAHAFDLLLGDSQLLIAAGCPAYSNLPAAGQFLALIWCAAGPIAFATTRMNHHQEGSATTAATIADAGLIFYGSVEVACAAVVAVTAAAAASNPPPSMVTTATSTMNPLASALAVQLVVAASWLYSSQKTKDEKAE